MEQFSRLIEFRQATYEHGLTKARDAQFELVDALLLGRPVRSFPELSLLPPFRRKWHSGYAAIERGGQDGAWLEGSFIRPRPRHPRPPQPRPRVETRSELAARRPRRATTVTAPSPTLNCATVSRVPNLLTYPTWHSYAALAQWHSWHSWHT